MVVAVSGSKGFFGKTFTTLLKEKGGFNIVELDISEGIDLSDRQFSDGIQKFDYFVHFANLSFVPHSFENPYDFYNTNFSTTLNALELCRKYSAKFIYISSYVYGNPEYLPVDEKHPIVAFNPYAQSKVICEQLCEGYHRDFDVDVTIFRPFNLYGFGQKNLIIAEIVEQIKQGKKSINLRNSKPRRDYVNVTDATEALFLAVAKEIKGFNIFNIASNKSYSVKEMTEIFEKYLEGMNISFTFDNNEIRRNEVYETRGSYQNAQEVLGWNPKISFESGIKEILIKEQLIKY